MKKIPQLIFLLIGLSTYQIQGQFLKPSALSGNAAAQKACVNDPSSFSNCDELYTTHFKLDVTVDFSKQSILGTNTLNMTALKDNVNQVVLDFQGIVIQKVEQLLSNQTWQNLSYSTYEDPILGSAMTIPLSSTVNNGTNITMRVAYYTTSESSSISWLTKEQTATKVLQYLFTQCEPIYCRSVAPLQDTPSIKSTYEANVKVANPYVVKMSAKENPATANADNTTTYHFYQDIKIPSYLLAIAVGNLRVKSVGPRTSIIAEPGEQYLDRYANELSELETLLNTTEAYLIPYIWGNYTILVLPPSFPFGGMENPLLTFASPTIIVGDKSQVYVATHEIAHSWTGNDVTCRDWSNMWLNEGFTVFEERKVTGQLKGEEFAKIEAQLGNVSLWEDINSEGQNNSYSSLHPVFNGANPDDAFNQVQYEKGFQFLLYLESLMKVDTDFRDMIRAYIQNFTQQSITYLEFKQFFESWLQENYKADAQAIIDKVDWEAWVKQGGANPPEASILNFTTAGAVLFENLADEYITLLGDKSPDNFNEYLTTQDPQLKVIFLNRLLARSSEVTAKLLTKIDLDLNVTNDPNPEIGQEWFPLTIAHQYTASIDAMHSYVSRQGRLKYIKAVYVALVANQRRDLAYKWFIENQNFYHPIAVAQIRQVVLQGTPSVQDQQLLDKLRIMSLSGGLIF